MKKNQNTLLELLEKRHDYKIHVLAELKTIG